MTKDSRIQTIDAVVSTLETKYFPHLHAEKQIHVLGRSGRTLYHVVHESKDYKIIKEEIFKKPFNTKFIPETGLGVLFGYNVRTMQILPALLSLSSIVALLRYDFKAIGRSIKFDRYVEYKNLAKKRYDEIVTYQENGEFDRIHGKFYIS